MSAFILFLIVASMMFFNHFQCTGAAALRGGARGSAVAVAPRGGSGAGAVGVARGAGLATFGNIPRAGLYSVRMIRQGPGRSQLYVHDAGKAVIIGDVLGSRSVRLRSTGETLYLPGTLHRVRGSLVNVRTGPGQNFNVLARVKALKTCQTRTSRLDVGGGVLCKKNPAREFLH